jgi:hypothetical protein
MKRNIFLILAIGLVLTWTMPVMAQFYGQDQSVRGYTRHNGTYVQPHHQTAPDGNRFNNYSTQGNINPYTGQMGTVNPYSQPMTPAQPYPSQRRQR